MKKIISLVLCAVLALSVPVGCTVNTARNDKIKVVVTIFPQYDWARQIIGDKLKDNYELTLLLDNGVDLHSYQPTADDIIKISGCDLVIYTGGESDVWLDKLLSKEENKGIKALNLLDALGDSALREEIKEGMQAEEEEEEGEEEEEEEYDEHIWLSLKNAKILCKAICKELCAIDAKNKNAYEDNTAAYINRLNELDAKYKDAVDGASKKTLLFGDRFPFLYMTKDYGLDYYAAFIGCSAESEASFETIMFLANKVDQLSLKSICKIESSDGKIADTVKTTAKSNDTSIVTFDSMQSATAADVNNGVTYLSIMEKNLEALKTALK